MPTSRNWAFNPPSRRPSLTAPGYSAGLLTQPASPLQKGFPKRLPVLPLLLILAFFGQASSCTIDKNLDTLVWSDEFNGDAISSDNWTYDIGTGAEKGLSGWGNEELQYYTKREENIRLAELPGGGRGLVIEAHKETYGGRSYTSARLLTQGLKSWTYGRIEARMRLPEGQGYWPAFWMLGSNIDSVKWPACGEIDIMEYKGQEPGKVHGTIHYGEPHAYTGSSYQLPGGAKFSEDFHVFAVEWRSGEIRWYVDGLQYGIQRKWSSSAGDYPAPFNQPFFILINLAIGGNFVGSPNGSTVFPQKMYVDWVRVYQ